MVFDLDTIRHDLQGVRHYLVGPQASSDPRELWLKYRSGHVAQHKNCCDLGIEQWVFLVKTDDTAELKTILVDGQLTVAQVDEQLIARGLPYKLSYALSPTFSAVECIEERAVQSIMNDEAVWPRCEFLTSYQPKKELTMPDGVLITAAGSYCKTLSPRKYNVRSLQIGVRFGSVPMFVSEPGSLGTYQPLVQDIGVTSQSGMSLSEPQVSVPCKGCSECSEGYDAAAIIHKLRKLV